MKDVLVFHAGTARRDGRLVTNGGRVLNVTALGDTLQAAVERAYEAVGMIQFEGMHARRDIAARALAATAGALTRDETDGRRVRQDEGRRHARRGAGLRELPEDPRAQVHAGAAPAPARDLRASTTTSPPSSSSTGCGRPASRRARRRSTARSR